MVKDFPLEKGNSFHWTVRVKEIGEDIFLSDFPFLLLQPILIETKKQTEGRGEKKGPALSVGVAPKEENMNQWPCWGASKGWSLAFWGYWDYGVFSHQNAIEKKVYPKHNVCVGDVFEVLLSGDGEMVFVLNGEFFPFFVGVEGNLVSGCVFLWCKKQQLNFGDNMLSTSNQQKDERT